MPNRHRKESSTVLDVLTWTALETEKLMGSISKYLEADCDSIVIFFKNMWLAGQKFPPHLIAETKALVFKLINDLEMESAQDTCVCACGISKIQ